MVTFFIVSLLPLFCKSEVNKTLYLVLALITLLLPLGVILMIKAMGKTSQIYIVSVNKTSNPILVDFKSIPLLSDANLNDIEEVKRFSISDINWNTKYNIRRRNKLIFCDNLLNCLNINSKLSIFVKDQTTDYRSSSPLKSFRNVLYVGSDFNVNETKQHFEKFDNLYLFKDTPDLTEVRNLMSCSPTIEINLSKNYSKNCDYTYLSEKNMIMQRKCVKIMANIVQMIDIPCSIIESSFYFKQDNDSLAFLKIQTLDFKNNDYCCFNSSHTVRLFGNCDNRVFFNPLEENLAQYRPKTCDGLYKVSSFEKISKHCIRQISHFTKCFSDQINVDACDYQRFSCKKVVDLI